MFVTHSFQQFFSRVFKFFSLFCIVSITLNLTHQEENRQKTQQEESLCSPVHKCLTLVSTVVCLTIFSSLCWWFLVAMGPALFFSSCFCVTHRADYKYIRLLTDTHTVALLCTHYKAIPQSVRQNTLRIWRLITVGFRCSISCSALLIFSCSISLLMVCLAW